MLRALIPALLLTLASLPGCQAESGPVLAAGTWTVDKEASIEATLPLWRSESSERMEAEMDAFVKPVPDWSEKYRRGATKELQDDFPDEIAHFMERVDVTVNAFPSKRFEMKAGIPELRFEECSGTTLVTEGGNVHFILREIDGTNLEQDEAISARFDDQGRLMIRWNDYLITVLTLGE
jgi:hypothetical protein